MKIGLVLEGGAMRGLYTSGVLDVFLKENIIVDCIIGVSAGALFGINYCSNQPGRVLRYQKKYVKEKDYIGLRIFLKTGNIINKELAYYDIPRKYDIFDEETFQKSKTKFYAVVTNIKTGQAEYIQITDTKKQIKVFEATGAMPFVSKIVEIGNEKYLDGALADSIPVEKMRELGYDKIIVVLTKPAGYRKKKSPSFMAEKRYKDYPKLVEAINSRYLHYNATLDKIKQLEESKEIFVIRPSKKIKMSRMEKDPAKIEEMYNLGVTDTNNIINNLKTYLEENTQIVNAKEASLTDDKVKI